MNTPYLEVTYRNGRALAAYLYLPRKPKDKSYKTKRIEPGLLIDFNRQGAPIGIEITAPSRLSANALNKALRDLGLAPLKSTDLKPLRAA